MVHVGDGRQREHGSDLTVVLWPLRAHDEEGGGALGVAYVEELLLASVCQHIVYHVGQVLHAKLVPAEVPELTVAGRQTVVVSRVGITTEVTHPYIVAGISEDVTF